VLFAFVTSGQHAPEYLVSFLSAVFGTLPSIRRSQISSSNRGSNLIDCFTQLPPLPQILAVEVTSITDDSQAGPATFFCSFFKSTFANNLSN